MWPSTLTTDSGHPTQRPGKFQAEIRALLKGEVHLWTVGLAATPDHAADCYQKLSLDEKQRADAFCFEKHRKRFIIARYLLREILGWYLEEPSEQIRFCYSPKGKPALADHPGRALYFNLAHSEDCVVYALSSDCDLGVDVEYVRELPNADSIATRFFSRDESADFLLVPLQQRTEAFFNCWTRKEAYLKAIGDGLSESLDAFQVSLIPGQPATLLKVRDRYPVPQWTLMHLVPQNGYVGALAIACPARISRKLLFLNLEECMQHLKAYGR